MTTAVVPFEQQMTLAKAFAASGLFGLKSPEQALALMALCEAEGMHPAKAVQRYHIVQGRPAMKADTMLAEFQKAGGKVDWKEYTDTRVTGIFSHASGGSVTVSWDIAQAQKAGLAGKDVWKHYPRSMLRSRCISEGVRAVFPGVVEGVYTPEEIESMPPESGAIDGSARRVTEAPALPSLSDELLATAEAEAAKGYASFSAWWETVSEDDGAALTPRLKELTKKARAVTVETEAAQ